LRAAENSFKEKFVFVQKDGVNIKLRSWVLPGTLGSVGKVQLIGGQRAQMLALSSALLQVGTLPEEV
jgi:hypothetical protein